MTMTKNNFAYNGTKGSGDFADVTLLLIVGGKSSRMGRDKRFAEIEGSGLLERTLKKAREENFAAIILCAEKIMPPLQSLAEKYAARIVVDKMQGTGPAAGIAQGLAVSDTERAFALSGDMPFFDFAVARPLAAQCTDEVPVVLPVGNGRKQPLAAFYRRKLAGVFANALRNGRRKIADIIDEVPHLAAKVAADRACFFNVNTPADLRLARGRAINFARTVPVVSVVAPASGTGKTTFIERLTTNLTARGLRVGVIKSDAHGFQPDTEGKDSHRFREAGATSVAVVAPTGWMIVQNTEQRAHFAQVAAKMENIDILLTESRTHGTMPALSLWRGKGEPILSDDAVAVFAKNLPALDSREISAFDLDDIEAAAELCLFLTGKEPTENAEN